MRFTCDSCSAQYMISDEKVGPGGVKVRCKRCGHVILVAAPPAAPPVVEPAPEVAGEPPPPPPAGSGAAAAETGLDLELGQAFENVFGGGSMAGAAPAADAAVAPAGGEGAVPAGGEAPPEPAVEWYVAIDDAQVGPLLADGVKARWESGEVGPDTLVWKTGMGDWSPLSTVPELAQLLAPIPRPSARPAPRPAEAPPAAEAARAAPPAAVPAAEPEPGWKPTAATALAALASEELAAMAPPAAAPASVPASGSLVEKMALPEGGIEPTGMVPLQIKGVEATAETLLSRKATPRPRTETTEVRELRKSTNRRLVGVVVALCAVFGGGAAALVLWMGSREKPVAVAPATPAAPAPVPAAAPAVPAPAAAAPVAAAPATAVPAAPPVAAAPAPAVEPAPPTAAVAPSPVAEEKPAPAAPRAAAAPAAKTGRKPRTEPVKAARAPKAARPVAAARPAPAPAAPRKPAGDPLLDVAGEDELSREPTAAERKRSVYVPPAPGSDLADRVTDPQIIEGVMGKKPALAACVEEQRAADAAVKGTLLLRWTIAPDGSVREVKNLTPEYGRQPVTGCISGVVKGIRFPKTRGGREVESFPFKF